MVGQHGGDSVDLWPLQGRNGFSHDGRTASLLRDLRAWLDLADLRYF